MISNKKQTNFHDAVTETVWEAGKLVFCAAMGLTEHGLQSDQTGDKVVKVDSHVCLCVAQDDQLE